MADNASVAESIDKDRKEKVKAMSKWMTTNMNDLTPDVAKKYAKKLYDAGVPTVEKLVKKLGKDSTYLRTSKLGIDEDDAKELVVVLSSVFGVRIGIPVSSSVEEMVSQTASIAGVASGGGTGVFLSPDFIAADRKDKAEEMITWYRTNTCDITVPNMHLYAYTLYDDNCATISKAARKLERDSEYLHNLKFDPDDIREIVGSLKMLGMLRADFELYDEKGPSGATLAVSSAAVEIRKVAAPRETGDEVVVLLEVDSSSEQPKGFDWGKEVEGLLVSVFSEETRTWLEGRIVKFDEETHCHFVRFPDEFELDIDLNTTQLLRIEECQITLDMLAPLGPAKHKALRTSFATS